MEIKPLIFNKLSLEFRRAEFQKKPFSNTIEGSNYQLPRHK